MTDAESRSGALHAAADAVAGIALASGLTVAVAESLTGGMIAAALAAGRDASTWFRGGLVAYSAEVKRNVLGVHDGPVVCGSAAESMASGVADLMEADVAISVTGEAGPVPDNPRSLGVVWLGLHIRGTTTSAVRSFGTEMDVVLQSTIDWALDVLRASILDA